MTKYGRTLEAGGSVCGICEIDRNLGVDHCHKTGLTRGNLCRDCNAGIGMFDYNTERLEKAIRYLRSWESP